jgi:PKD repeat protein
MAENGYAGEELLSGVQGLSYTYQGSPPDASVSAGLTTQVDDTASGTYELTGTNAELAEIGLGSRADARQAPEEPPEDPEIVDEGGDVNGDTVPASQMDIQAGWFDADASHLYVGLELDDIPQNTNTTAFTSYRVGFQPDYEVEDPTWGGTVPEDATLTELRTFAAFSPLAFDNLTEPTTRQSPSFELQLTYEQNGRSFFATVGDIEEASIDPETDIVWWAVDRDLLQSPPPDSRIVETTATSAPAIDGLLTFQGATADTAGPGDPFSFPKSADQIPPTVTLDASPVSGSAPLDVTFQPDTDADDVASWTIRYGDGATESGTGGLPAELGHVYDAAGEHTATLEVTDSNGQTGSAKATVNVTPPEGRSVRVTAGDLDPVWANCEDACSTWTAALDLDALEPDTTSLTATLVEDGEVLGRDTVAVEVTPDDGLTVLAPEEDQRLPPGDVRVQGEIDDTDRPPRAMLDAEPQRGSSPLDVTFDLDGADDEGVVSWRLLTDDGTVIDGTQLPIEAEHTYDEPGNYTATLQVTDTAGQRDTRAVPIEVDDENEAPETPNSPTPADGSGDVPRPPTLSWEASDPDGDELVYDVYLDTSAQPDTLVRTGLEDPSFVATDLEPSTTYHWQVVADDGLTTTEGPVWSFTTAAASGLANSPQTVIAYIDSGGFPYHEQFQRAEHDQHPSEYIEGYPADAQALDLCFFDQASGTVDRGNCPDSPTAAAEQDVDEWRKLGVSGTGQTGPGEGDLAYVPGTNVVGAISFAHDGDADYPTLDGDKGDGDAHGTWVAGSIAGQTTGSCPDCLIVTIEADSVSAIESGWQWAAQQPWIDGITSSVYAGICTPVGVCQSIDGFATSIASSTQTAAENGKLVFEAAGNGVGGAGLATSTTAPDSNFAPWSISVGCSSESGHSCLYSDEPAPITATGTPRQTADPGTYDGTNDPVGTSFSSPSAAGVAGQALVSLRAELGATTEGPAADANNSLVEPASDATLPEDTALTNGELTKK